MKARLAFVKLSQTFSIAPILHYYNPECYILIEINALSYGIGTIIIQLTLNSSGQWHPIALLSQKMILTKIQYKNYNGKFLVIVKAFRTWHYHLEDGKYEFFTLINHNNLCYFINIYNVKSR